MGTNGSFPSPIRVWPENSWPYLVRGSNIKCWCFRNWRRNCMSWPWLTAMCLGLVGNWDHEASFRMEASADDEQLVNDLSWLLISVYIYVHIYIYIYTLFFKCPSKIEVAGKTPLHLSAQWGTVDVALPLGETMKCVAMTPFLLLFGLPSGYLTVCHGKSPFLIGKPSINGPSIPWLC